VRPTATFHARRIARVEYNQKITSAWSARGSPLGQSARSRIAIPGLRQSTFSKGFCEYDRLRSNGCKTDPNVKAGYCGRGVGSREPAHICQVFPLADMSPSAPARLSCLFCASGES
jgi:hypothetical protein